MLLDNKQIKAFRSIGHRLNPIIQISSGLNDNIHAELERALNDHELIKIKFAAMERESKQALLDEVCQGHQATLVQKIGHVALIYRAAKKPNPKLSNLARHRELL